MGTDVFTLCGSEKYIYRYCGTSERADKLVSTADITTSLQLDKAEVLRCSRNFLNKDRPEQKSVAILKEREVEKSGGRSTI